MTTPAARLAANLLDQPWGSMSRTELDFVVFRFLVEDGHIDLSNSDFDIAQELLTTPTRIKALRFRIEQRNAKAGTVDLESLILPRNFIFTRGVAPGTIRVRMNSEFLRRQLQSKLDELNAMNEHRFDTSVVEVAAADFTEALHRMIADAVVDSVAGTSPAAIDKVFRKCDKLIQDGRTATGIQALKDTVGFAANVATVLNSMLSVLSN